VAVLDRAIAVGAPPFLLGQVRGGKGDPVAYDELLPRVERLDVEDEQIRVHESRQQHARRAQDAEALPPDRGQVRAEHVRHRVEDEVEAAIAERAQIPHVAEHRPDGLGVQAVPGSHLLVAAELPGRVVEYRHVRARGGENRTLLPAT